MIKVNSKSLATNTLSKYLGYFDISTNETDRVVSDLKDLVPESFKGEDSWKADVVHVFNFITDHEIILIDYLIENIESLSPIHEVITESVLYIRDKFTELKVDIEHDIISNIILLDNYIPNDKRNSYSKNMIVRTKQHLMEIVDCFIIKEDGVYIKTNEMDSIKSYAALQIGKDKLYMYEAIGNTTSKAIDGFRNIADDGIEYLKSQLPIKDDYEISKEGVLGNGEVKEKTR